MRESLGAVALIRREHQGRTLWLTRWNARWRAYHFVAGHKRGKESFRECIVREVSEELHLRHDMDFTVAPTPLAHIQFPAWSESAREETTYTTEVFAVRLTESAEQGLGADSSIRWLDEEEIRSHECADGKPVSTTADFLLNHLGRDAG